MDINVPTSINTIKDIESNVPFFKPNKKLGIFFSFICLFLLGILPIISNSRPMTFSALDYTMFLSVWEFVFSIPLFLQSSLRTENRGIFDKKIQSDLKQKTLIVILITGVLFLFSTFLYVLTFEKVGTVNAAIAVQTFPVFTIILETIFLSKKKTNQELFFTLLLIIALVYLGTNGTFIFEKLSFWFILALAVPLLWSVAHLTLKLFMEKSSINPPQIIFFRVAISSVLLLILLILLEGPNVVVDELLNTNYQIYALAMGLVYYFELVNWFNAIKNIDVSLAGSITTPTPVITMIFALMFLQEILHLYQLISLTIVCLSLYGILYSGSKNDKKINLQ